MKQLKKIGATFTNVSSKIFNYLKGVNFKEVIKSIIGWCKKHIIIFIAIIAISLFAYISRHGKVPFPFEYIQKIPFGILGAAVILWCAFLWVRIGIPGSWDKLDDRTEGGVNSLSEWEKVKQSDFYLAIFIFTACILAFAL